MSSTEASADEPLPPAKERVRLSTTMRLLVGGAVVLVALASGLGVVALIESGEKTWTSTARVQLLPGPAPTANVADTLKAGQLRYGPRVSGLTSRVAANAQVPDADLRDPISASPAGGDQLRITARAAHPDEAERLAGAAASLLAQALPADQVGRVHSAGDRLDAVVSGPATAAKRTRPSDLLAAVAGSVVAGGLLLSALCLSVVRSRVNH